MQTYAIFLFSHFLEVGAIASVGALEFMVADNSQIPTDPYNLSNSLPIRGTLNTVYRINLITRSSPIQEEAHEAEQGEGNGALGWMLLSSLASIQELGKQMLGIMPLISYQGCYP